MQQQIFTMRPTPNLKGCYDIACNGQVVAQTFGRPEAKQVLRGYQLGIRKVVIVEAVGAK